MVRTEKILVVDDYDTMRGIIATLLHDLGFVDVRQADDGATALPMLRRERFDLLITDWNMPKMKGLDLVRAIRNDPSMADLPVLMVTAEAKREQIVEAAALGIAGYVVKPFTSRTLRGKLSSIFTEQVS